MEGCTPGKKKGYGEIEDEQTSTAATFELAIVILAEENREDFQQQRRECSSGGRCN